MSDHLLRLARIECEGFPVWSMTCEHSPDDERWWCREPDGSPVLPPGPDGCWFESWWDAVGSELLDDIAGPITLPLPVKPSPEWTYDDGGTIVADVTA